MVWTLFDYYGEPPVGGPEVSSTYGQYDLCGFPKAAGPLSLTPALTLTPTLFLALALALTRPRPSGTARRHVSKHGVSSKQSVLSSK